MNGNGTEGRVYGGDPNLLHIPDGQREAFGIDVANYAIQKLREINGGSDLKPCPGCCNVVVFNVALELARQSGQSVTEMAASLSLAFTQISTNNKQSLEEIEIILDPC